MTEALALNGGKLAGELFWVDRWTGSAGFLLPIGARGLYREMLSQAWRRGGRLPVDFASVRRACGVTAREWANCWPKIRQFWRVVRADDGQEFLVNDTQLEIYERVQRVRRARQQAGKRGGRPSKPESKTEANDKAKRKDPNPNPKLDLGRVPAGVVLTYESTDPPAPKARRDLHPVENSETSTPATTSPVEIVVENAKEPVAHAAQQPTDAPTPPDRAPAPAPTDVRAAVRDCAAADRPPRPDDRRRDMDRPDQVRDCPAAVPDAAPGSADDRDPSRRASAPPDAPAAPPADPAPRARSVAASGVAAADPGRSAGHSDRDLGAVRDLETFRRYLYDRLAPAIERAAVRDLQQRGRHARRVLASGHA